MARGHRWPSWLRRRPSPVRQCRHLQSGPESAPWEAWFAGVTRRRIDEAEIVERLVLAMVSEAAAILSEGIAARASDIYLVTVLGYGFPRRRGGLMHHADSLGAKAIVARLSE